MAANHLQLMLPRSVSLQLSSSVTIDSLEEGIVEWCRSAGDWSHPMEIDMGDVEWIDVASLMHIVATFYARKQFRYRTQLRLPRLRKVRDFLRVWRFASTMEMVTQQRFAMLVNPDDHALFERAQISYPEFGRKNTRAGNVLEHLESSRFFGFGTYLNLTSYEQDSMISHSCQAWSGPLVMRVLNRYLYGAGNDLARVVIYESLSNAWQHPDADVVSIVSKIDYRGLGDSLTPTMLTICVWDSGTPIVETLKERIRAGKHVRVPVDESLLKERFLLEESGTGSTHEFAAGDTPTLEWNDSEVLLSSLFPGITRRAESHSAHGGSPIDSQDIHGSELIGAQPGMGLFALLEQVTNQFKGRLTFRTGDRRMSVRASNDAEKRQFCVSYRAKTAKYPNFVPPFQGNMLTIRLPLKTG